MTLRALPYLLLLCGACFVSVGCHAPGKPDKQVEARPDQLTDVSTLYQQNCAACHGEHGQGGASTPLANPLYLAIAGADNIKRITAEGVPGTAMPPFARSAGGMLTDRQITILTEGMLQAWGHPSSGALLPFASSASGNVANGRMAYTTFCARCHGADGQGTAASHTGSIVDPSYLALVSDQNLRSTILAGLPTEGMPDWRSDATGPSARAMSDQEVTDTVAWLASNRTSFPGQPYRQQP